MDEDIVVALVVVVGLCRRRCSTADARGDSCLPLETAAEESGNRRRFPLPDSVAATSPPAVIVVDVVVDVVVVVVDVVDVVVDVVVRV